MAGSLVSDLNHALAQAIVAAATARGLVPPTPADVAEIPGEDVEGHVESRKVIVVGDRFVAARVGRPSGDHPAMAAGSVLVAVAVDGHIAGHLVTSGSLREDAGAMLDGLCREGTARILRSTGDRTDVAGRVTEGPGLDGVVAGLPPEKTVLLVLSERRRGPIMMLGDGANDAPARAAADVGVAMGAWGADASAGSPSWWMMLSSDGIARPQGPDANAQLKGNRPA